MRVLHKPLGRQSYEGLAEWAGGSSWRIATQVALLMLLWGTLCSGLALLSDVAVVMADMAFPGGEAPAWLSGRLLMTAMALLVLFPLCLLRHMRQVCVGLAVCVCVWGGACVGGGGLLAVGYYLSSVLGLRLNSSLPPIATARSWRVQPPLVWGWSSA